MSFKFYIGGQLTDQPVNDTALSTSISRDRQLNSMVVTQDVSIVYNGNNIPKPGEVSGFTLIKNAFESGTCNELDLVVYDQASASQTVLIYTGVIKVPEVRYDEQRMFIESAIRDNSFYAYIHNNRSVEFNVQSIRTKNRLAITPPQIYEVDMFDSFSGVYASAIGWHYRQYRVYDVFKYLTLAISDNKVSFESYFLQNNPQLFIADGFALSNHDRDPTVKVSFGKLYEEIKKIKNVSFFIDASDQANPVLRLEDVSSLFSGIQILSFDDLLHLKSYIKTDNIYSVINVGASYNPGGANPLIFTFIAGTSYLGWAEEKYTPLGQCNFNNELDLVNDFYITSNAIQDQLVGVVSDNLDQLFLIECENVDTAAFTATAVAYDSWATPTAHKYYNQGLNNPSKLNNHASNYQTGLTNTLEIGGNGFQASLGQEELLASYAPASPQNAAPPGVTISPVVFADETTGSNYDGGGNYNNATGVYVASLDGVYSFNAQMTVDAINIVTCPVAGTNVGFQVFDSPILTVGNYYTPITRGFIMKLRIKVYADNTLAVLLSQTETTQKFTSSVIEQNYTVNNTVQLNTGEAVIVEAFAVADVFAQDYFGSTGILNELNPLPNWSIGTFGCVITNAYPEIYFKETSLFKCTGAPDGGGVTVDNDPALFRNRGVEFEYSINQTDWLNIKANPTGMFAFEKDGVTRYGWIDKMTRNDQTGQTKIQLIIENATTSQ